MHIYDKVSSYKITDARLICN